MDYLKNILDPITENGIFQTMHILNPDIEWLTDANVKYLDIEYYYGHSSDKMISRLYEKMIDRESAGIIESSINAICNMITGFYRSNWDNVYKAYSQEYNPLENYSMIEKENVNSKVKTSVASAQDVYGFNSNESVPASKVNNESTTEGSKEDNERDLTRSGNIGVTTSQQMLQSEIDLRKFAFYIQVMNDIDKIMCLKIY